VNDAARLLWRVYPWLPLAFILEVAAYYVLFYWTVWRKR
jgi:hypothetical protein